MGTGENSTPGSHVNTWSQLGKLSGLYTDRTPQTSIDDLLRDITANNAANRNGLLPKNNIRLEDRVYYDDDDNVIR